MRFLVDVNASGSLAELLIDLGHDVVLVRDKNPRMRDEEILNWAVAERRIIVTTDKDFEAMVWRQGRKHCGLLRIENLPRQERLMLLRETLKYYAKELDRGAIVIALTQKFRIRHPR